MCTERAIRLIDQDTDQDPRLEICKDDMWIALDSTLRMSSENVISNLRGIPTAPNIVDMSWQVSNSVGLTTITGYDVTCSNSEITSVSHVNGDSTRATLTTLLPSTYQCCVVAYLNRDIFSFVEHRTSECISVTVQEEVPVVVVGASAFDLSTVTYTLGGLLGLLLVIILLFAIGCIHVLLSKRKYQITQR